MATNYMTVLEHEIDMTNVRLWRLKEAIENPNPEFVHDELDRQLMKLRYDVTLKLYRILLLQGYLWEGCGDDEKNEILKNSKNVEDLLSEHEPDIEKAKAMYGLAIDECEHFGPDFHFLDILHPQGWWNDLSKERKTMFEKEAKRCLSKMNDYMNGTNND